MAKRKIVLDDGTEFFGVGFGGTGEAVFEVVFNTSMVGYQEIITDPAYIYKGVVMTYPIIGSYGINSDDNESKGIKVSSLIVREYNDLPSNFRYTKTLGEVMEENNVPCIAEVDTRSLTRHIRDNGTMKAVITDAETPVAEALSKIASASNMTDALEKASCAKRWYSRTASHKYNVALIDCGADKSIIRSLNECSCNVVIMPFNSTADEILSTYPDGIFVSNGPGDPESSEAEKVTETVKKLIGAKPICGVSLGMDIIARACGADTYRLKFGHYGSNHMVKELSTGLDESTVQAHEYAVDADSLKSTGLSITHVNVMDNTVEGIEWSEKNIYALQFSPESAEGPNGRKNIYAHFTEMMEENKNAEED